MKDRRQLWRVATRQLTPVIAAYTAPVGLLCCWLYFSRDTTYLALMEVPLFWLMNVWILSSLFAFVLTSLPMFLFLGEAERYLEYSAGAASILFTLWLIQVSPDSTFVVLVLVLMQAGICLTLYVLESRFGGIAPLAKPGGQESLRQAAEAVAGLHGQNLKIATVPFKAAYSVSLAFRKERIKAKYFYYMISRRGNWGYPYMSRPARVELPSFEIPPYSLDELRRLFRIDLVLLDRKYAKAVEPLWGSRTMAELTRVFEDEQLLVLDIRNCAVAPVP